MKKLLTSILAIGFAMPAMADITAQSTCDTNALGQSDNNSTANVEASWTANTYSEPAGQYLLFANDTITQHTTCPAGSFCVGFSNQAFTDSSMGIESCPTGYANSAAGATAQSQCYNPGTANCATRNPYTSGHGTAVYGNATNVSAETCKTYYGDTTTCVLDNANACDITALNCDTGYHQAGGTSPLASVDLDTEPSEIGYKSHSGSGRNSNDANLNNGEWYAEFSYGTVKGRASCNKTKTYAAGGAVTQPSNAFSNNSKGQYCWCQTESFTPTGGSTVGASSSWVFSYDLSTASDCALDCALDCARLVRDVRDFRGPLFGSVGETSLQCIANTINIDWDPQNGESHTTNQCTYDGAITLPTEPSKTGYTFGGWRLKQN